MRNNEKIGLAEVSRVFQISHAEGTKIRADNSTNFLKDLRELLKSKHRKLAMEYHPDRGGTNAKFERFQNLYDLIMSIRASAVDLRSPQRRGPVVVHFSFGGPAANGGTTGGGTQTSYSIYTNIHTT